MTNTQHDPERAPREFEAESAFVSLLAGVVFIALGIWFIQNDAGSSTVCGRGWGNCVSSSAIHLAFISIGLLGIGVFFRDVWR